MFQLVALVLLATTVGGRAKAIISAIEGGADLANKAIDHVDLPVTYIGPDGEYFQITRYPDRVIWERLIKEIGDGKVEENVLACRMLFEADRGERAFAGTTEKQKDIVRAARRVWEKYKK